MNRLLTVVTMAVILIGVGCAETKPPAKPWPRGLALSLAVLKTDPAGKPVPQPARAVILVNDGESWSHRIIEDPDSNVFHKVMVYEPTPGESGLLTLGGTRALIKLRRKGSEPEVLWEKDFGGKFSRMRDAEVADLYGDGSATIAVVTHDQGVVATVRPDGSGGYAVEELDREVGTIVHEVEVGDLDKDGVIEIYATPSEPNKFDGTPQPGRVVRYVPAKKEGRTEVASLGDRHAKEILVDDVDGDGTDELYVVVEAVSGGQVEIRRYDAGTDPATGIVITELSDRLCRFLTVGDIDGDGKKEMVAATHKSGLWLLRPGVDPKSRWSATSIDRDSSGFEHASIVCDLDGDGRDELYVASDTHKEVRRYEWKGGEFAREVLYTHPEDISIFTWNLMPVPVGLLPN